MYNNILYLWKLKAKTILSGGFFLSRFVLFSRRFVHHFWIGDEEPSRDGHTSPLRVCKRVKDKTNWLNNEDEKWLYFYSKHKTRMWIAFCVYVAVFALTITERIAKWPSNRLTERSPMLLVGKSIIRKCQCHRFLQESPKWFRYKTDEFNAEHTYRKMVCLSDWADRWMVSVFGAETKNGACAMTWSNIRLVQSSSWTDDDDDLYYFLLCLLGWAQPTNEFCTKYSLNVIMFVVRRRASQLQLVNTISKIWKFNEQCRAVRRFARMG